MATPPDFTAGTALAADSLNKVGLWRVGSVTASSTTIALDSVFTTDYNCYRIFATQTSASVTGTTIFRFRSGGSAIATGSYYYGGHVYYYNAVPGNWYANAATSFPVIISSGATQTHTVIDVSFPRSANRKSFTAMSTHSYSNYIGSTTHGIVDSLATNYDGLQFTQDAGATLAMTVIVYGYNEP